MFVFSLALVASISLNGLVADAAKATFGTGTNITGSVTVEAGSIEVDIDLSKFNTSLLPNGSYCYKNGLKYHIHEMWTHVDTKDYITTGCNATYTGGHWDPWTACSSSTGNNYCLVENKPISCVKGSVSWKDGDLGYSCDSTNYTVDPYVCEVGDWSGKYGVLEIGSKLTGTASHESAWEVDGTDLAGYAVVFHCTDDASSRAFCAPFEDTESDSSTKRVDQSSADSKKASFSSSSLGDDSYVVLNNDNTYDIRFDISGLVLPLGCGELMYRVYNSKATQTNVVNSTDSDGRRRLQGNSTTANIIGNNATSAPVTSVGSNATGEPMTTQAGEPTTTESVLNCSALVTNFYDPTVSCAPGSQWEDKNYCSASSEESDSQKCDDIGYVYSCNSTSDHYSCAPGDLSGKYGTLVRNNDTSVYEFSGYDELMISLTDLEDRYVVLQCSRFPYRVLTCAAFEDYKSGSGSNNSESGAAWWVWLIIVIGVILLIVGVVWLVRNCKGDGAYTKIQNN